MIHTLKYRCIFTPRADFRGCTADHADNTRTLISCGTERQRSLTSSSCIPECKSNSESSCRVSIGESCNSINHDVTQTRKIRSHNSTITSYACTSHGSKTLNYDVITQVRVTSCWGSETSHKTHDPHECGQR